jgi:hypothetical protein
MGKFPFWDYCTLGVSKIIYIEGLENNELLSKIFSKYPA